MLDTVCKIIEGIIHSRLEGALVETNGLSDMQFGFRKALSTIQAVGKLCEIADKAIEGKRWLYGTKQYCIAATLDVKNAFNSASWHHTLNALSNINVPVYIQRVIASYFEGRLLLYETDSGQSTHRVTASKPKILGRHDRPPAFIQRTSSVRSGKASMTSAAISRIMATRT